MAAAAPKDDGHALPSRLGYKQCSASLASNPCMLVWYSFQQKGTVALSPSQDAPTWTQLSPMTHFLALWMRLRSLPDHTLHHTLRHTHAAVRDGRRA